MPCSLPSSTASFLNSLLICRKTSWPAVCFHCLCFLTSRPLEFTHMELLSPFHKMVYSGCQIHCSVLSPHLPWLLSSIQLGWSLSPSWNTRTLCLRISFPCTSCSFWVSFAGSSSSHFWILGLLELSLQSSSSLCLHSLLCFSMIFSPNRPNFPFYNKYLVIPFLSILSCHDASQGICRGIYNLTLQLFCFREINLGIIWKEIIYLCHFLISNT